MSHILALDQGTTSSRAIVFDRSGAVVSVAQREFRQVFPKPGWVEHDPEEIWSTQAGVMAEAMTRARLRARDIAAVGITNQRETTIVWDRKTGRPIHNAIVWQDRRTAAECDRLRAAGVEGVVREKTGLLLDSYFSAPKIAWILDHVKGARDRAERGDLAFGTVDSWLADRLTEGGLHITDVSNASRTLLLNIRTMEWDDELLRIFGIPRAMLPEVRASSEVYGEVSAERAAAGVKLAGIIGDQQGALMGQVCTRPGMAKNTYGTGCFLLVNTGSAPAVSKNRLLTTVAWRREDERAYALEGSIFVGGAIVQWLRDGLGIIRKASEVEALAATVSDTGGVQLVPALAGMGAPHWDPRARGAIVGISRGTTAAHIARAALEGIAMEVADLAQAMEGDTGSRISELRADGGAAANDLLMQFQADVLGVQVVRPKILETTALGAAYMAGLAAGFWGSVEDLADQWTVDRRFEPRMSGDEVGARREAWQRAVERARGWAMDDDVAGASS